MNDLKPPRVWHKKKKEMHRDLWRLVWGDDGKLCEVWANDRTCYQPDEVILLKPTGKQDKNGTEGYQKDLIKAIPSLPKTAEDYRLLTIEWSEEEARFYLAEPNGSESSCILGHFYLMEIVGNTLSNPDLLKETK